MNKGYRICSLIEIPDGGTREFQIPIGGRDTAIFVLRNEDAVIAFLNSCPHTGVALNWQPDDFLTVDRDYIQCSTHGALFRREDGYCVWGPCARQSLTALPLELRDGDIFLNI